MSRLIAITLVGQPEGLTGLSDLGSYLPRLTTWVCRVLLRPEYRHLLPAPVARTPASAWLYKHPWIACQKHKPNTSMTHIHWEWKLPSVVGSFMHACPGNWLSIKHAVRYYAWAAQAFSAGMKCHYCIGSFIWKVSILLWVDQMT